MVNYCCDIKIDTIFMPDDLTIIWYDALKIPDICYCDAIVCINSCYGNDLLW